MATTLEKQTPGGRDVALDARTDRQFREELRSHLGVRLARSGPSDLPYRRRWLEIRDSIAAAHPRLSRPALNSRTDESFWDEIRTRLDAPLSPNAPEDAHYRQRWSQIRRALGGSENHFATAANRAEEMAEAIAQKHGASPVASGTPGSATQNFAQNIAASHGTSGTFVPYWPVNLQDKAQVHDIMHPNLAGQGTMGLAKAMKGLYDLEDSTQAEPFLMELARFRGTTVEKMRTDYARYRVLRAEARESAGKKNIELPSELATLEEKEKEPKRMGDAFWGQPDQMAFGKIVGDALGVDAVFGAMLSPTGGLIGPGDDPMHDKLKRFGFIRTHGVVHDAAGYLKNYHNVGPGYEYVDALGKWAPHLPSDKHMYLGQGTGVAFWAKEYAKEGIGNTARGIGNAARKAGNWAADTASSAWDWMRSTGSDLWTGTKNKVREGAEWTKDKVGQGTEWTKNTAHSAWQGARAMAQDASETMHLKERYERFKIGTEQSPGIGGIPGKIWAGIYALGSRILPSDGDLTGPFLPGENNVSDRLVAGEFGPDVKDPLEAAALLHGRRVRANQQKSAIGMGAVVFVNGQIYNLLQHYEAAQGLADTMGRPVVGIFSATAPTAGIVQDTLQSAFLKMRMTRRMNPSTRTLVEIIKEFGDAKKAKPGENQFGALKMVGHSQGTIVIEEARRIALEEEGVDIANHDITTYGNAILTQHESGRYRHFMYEDDPVSRGVGALPLFGPERQGVSDSLMLGLGPSIGLPPLLPPRWIAQLLQPGSKGVMADGFQYASQPPISTGDFNVQPEGKDTIENRSPDVTGAYVIRDQHQRGNRLGMSFAEHELWNRDPAQRMAMPDYIRATQNMVQTGWDQHDARYGMDAQSVNQNIRNLVGPAIQRSANGSGRGGVDYAMASQLDPDALHTSLLQAGGTGTAPDSNLRGDLAPHLGFDPGEARLHTSPAAAQAARSLNAEAFTIGRDVFFGESRFDPATAKGRGLIAHELTHVGQQTGTIGSKARFYSQSGGDAMEQEAQHVGARVLANVGKPGGLIVKEYHLEFESEDEHGLSPDDQQRLERISLMALEEASRQMKQNGQSSGNLSSLSVDISLDLTLMSDTEAAQEWAKAMLEAIVARTDVSTVSGRASLEGKQLQGRQVRVVQRDAAMTFVPDTIVGTRDWKAYIDGLLDKPDADVQVTLTGLSHADRIELATSLFSVVRAPGAQTAVLRQALQQLDAEAVRIGVLNANYKSAYQSQNWQDIIMYLNAYNEADIRKRIMSWTPPELHEGVFQAKAQFGSAGVARLGSVMLERLPPPAAGPGIGPQLVSAGVDSVKMSLVMLVGSSPCIVNGGVSGDVVLQPGAVFDRKMLVSATPTGVHYVDGQALYVMWAPDFVRDVWLTGFIEGAKRAEGMAKLAKLEFMVLKGLFVPWWGVAGLTAVELLALMSERREAIDKLLAQWPVFQGARSEFRSRYPTLYDKMFWYCFKETAKQLPDGVGIEEIAYFLARVAGTSGLAGAFSKALQESAKVTAKTVTKIVAEYAVLVTLLHAPAIVGRAAKAATKETEKKAALMLQSGLNEVGITLTIVEATQIAAELAVGGDPTDMLTRLRDSSVSMSDALSIIIEWWENNAI